MQQLTHRQNSLLEHKFEDIWILDAEIPSDPEEFEIFMDIIKDVFVQLFDIPRDLIEFSPNEDNSVALAILTDSYDDALIIQHNLPLET